MKKIICLLLAVSVVVAACSCGKKEETEAVEEPKTNVTVFEAGKGNVKNNVSYTGTVVEGDYASITAKTSARVKSIMAEEGDYVKAGAVVATLDDTDIRLSYNQALAGYNSAVASYEMTLNASTEQARLAAEQGVESAQLEYNSALDAYNKQVEKNNANLITATAKNALEDAKHNLERTQALFDMGAATQVQLDAARLAVENAQVGYDNSAINQKDALDGARTRLEGAELALRLAIENRDLQTGVVAEKTIATAKAGVETAKASLEMAQNNLNNTKIVAPISGYISAKNIEKGQMVSPGIELFSVKNSDIVEVEINITEADIPFVKVGTETEIKVKSSDLKPIKGTVSMVNPTKSPKTGLYKVHIAIPNEESKLKIGMIADISLTLNESKNTITIPTEAIMQDGDKFFVYIADKDGKTATKAEIEKGIESADTTEIKKGIKNGDKIIIKGKEYLSEKNNKIKITNEK